MRVNSARTQHAAIERGSARSVRSNIGGQTLRPPEFFPNRSSHNGLDRLRAHRVFQGLVDQRLVATRTGLRPDVIEESTVKQDIHALLVSRDAQAALPTTRSPQPVLRGCADPQLPAAH